MVVRSPRGGALPLHNLETRVVRVQPEQGSAQDLAAALRLGQPPLVARVRGEAVHLDVRTLSESQIPEVVAALTAALGGEGK